MIEKNNFITLLKKYEIPQETISKVEKKQIKTLLDKGNYENIEGILKCLKPYFDKKILDPDKIIPCISIFSRGKAKEIESIIEVINKEKNLNLDILNACPSILAFGKAKKIETIIEVIKEEKNLNLDILNACPTILAKGKAQEIKSIIKTINEEKSLDIDILNRCPYILAQGKAQEIKFIIKTIKDEKNLNIDILNTCPSILAHGKAQEIEAIIKVIKEEKNLNLDILNACPSILAFGKAQEIKSIIKTINEEKSLNLDILNDCPYILAQGKAQEIKFIIKTIKKGKGINFDILNTCPTILIQGKAREIETIIEVIKREEALNLDIINTCPSILAFGKARKIETIIEIIKEEEALNLGILNTCPSILAQGKAKEIKAIIKVIKEEKNLNLDILNVCPTILVRGKAQEIEAIIKVIKDEKALNLDILNVCPSILAFGRRKHIQFVINQFKKYDISLKKIYKLSFSNLFLNKDFVSMMFESYSEKYNKEKYFLALKSYLIIQDKYPGYYSKEEITTLCKEKNILYCDFLKNIGKINNIEYINNTLKRQKIFLGSMPMTDEQLETYGAFILNISKQVAYQLKKSVLLNINYAVDDLSSFILEVLMNKAGGIIYNFWDDIKYLSQILKRYCMKTCLKFLKEQVMLSLLTEGKDGKEMSFMDHYTYNETKDESYQDNAKDILDSISFSREELELLKLMNQQLDYKDEIDYDEISLMISSSKEKVLTLVNTIQDKILNR